MVYGQSVNAMYDCSSGTQVAQEHILLSLWMMVPAEVLEGKSIS
jgi:hypothetical protein